jgi:hypothetical protein
MVPGGLIVLHDVANPFESGPGRLWAQVREGVQIGNIIVREVEQTAWLGVLQVEEVLA